MFDSYKPSGCAPSSGTCSKLHVETCIPLGDGDFHTSCTSWLSASFLQHADYSGFGRVWHTIGVTGRLALGLSCSGPRSFHKRPLGFGMKYLSQKLSYCPMPRKYEARKTNCRFSVAARRHYSSSTGQPERQSTLFSQSSKPAEFLRKTCFAEEFSIKALQWSRMVC